MKTKRGKNPTRKQKILLSEHNLNVHNWLVIDETAETITVKHKLSGTERNISLK